MSFDYCMISLENHSCPQCSSILMFEKGMNFIEFNLVVSTWKVNQKHIFFKYWRANVVLRPSSFEDNTLS